MSKQCYQELQQLTLVASTQSFSAAARELGLTPAAVSATVARHEKELEVRLFERSTRHVRLTDEGRIYIEHCQLALDSLEMGRASLSAHQNQLSGKLIVSVPTDIARTLMQNWFLEFTALHPKLILDLRTTDSLSNLHAEPIDVAIRYSTPKDSSLVAKPLYRAKRIACASPEYLKQHRAIVVPEDLAEHNCLRYHLSNQVDDSWRFYQGKRVFSVRVAGNLIANDSAICREWALQGKGIVYKSELDLHTDLNAGRLLPVLQDYEGQASPLYAVFPGRQNLPSRTRAFVDFVVAKFDQF